MVEKYAVWQRTRQGAYTLSEYTDPSLCMLFLLFGDGIGSDSYTDFLKNKDRKSFAGNMILLLKHDNMVTVTIDEAEESGLVDCEITIENLIEIIYVWNDYVDKFVDSIKITFHDDNVSVIGLQKDELGYNPQKLVFVFDERYKSYSLLSCEGETTYLLSEFLMRLSSGRIDQYIQWTLNIDEKLIRLHSSILEKKDGFIFIGLKVGESDVGAHYKISIKNFVELLKKWQMFERIGEPKIIVHEKDGNVVLDACHEQFVIAILDKL